MGKEGKGQVTWPRWYVRARTVDQSNLLQDVREDDIIIPVMGTTGVGKSTFINLIAGQDVMVVNHSLGSTTEHVKFHVMNLPGPGCPPALDYPELRGKRLILVDTPGFQDTNRDTTDILDEISTWLAYSYSGGTTVAGIVFLTDLSQTRVKGPDRLDMKVFEKLCGPRAASRMILGEVKWEHVDEATLERRRQEYANAYYRSMRAEGATSILIKKDAESAWSALDTIFKREVEEQSQARVRSTMAPLQIETELVEDNKDLKYTAAAGAVLPHLKEDMQECRKGMKSTSNPERREDLQNRMDSDRRQIKKLEKPLVTRIIGFFSH